MSSDAEREAEKRWPSYPTVGFSGAQDRQHAFVAGAEWERSRPVSEEEIKAVATRLAQFELPDNHTLDERLNVKWYRFIWHAQEALEAAAKVRAQGGTE